MKKALLLGLLYVLVGCSDSTGGLKLTIKYYENGQKRSEATTRPNGKREGVDTHWFDNGQKSSEWTYKDDHAEGVWTEWYKNGQKRREGTLKDHKLEGVLTEWHDNGQKQSEVTYKNDKEDGVKTFWDDKGNVMWTASAGRRLLAAIKDPDSIERVLRAMGLPFEMVGVAGSGRDQRA